MWNSGINIQNITNELKISRGTIRKYLKMGALINLCDYNPKFESTNKYKNIPNKSNHPNATKVICLTTKEIFLYMGDAVKKYNTTHITDCCQGKYKYAGKLSDGTKLIWMYYEDYLKII